MARNERPEKLNRADFMRVAALGAGGLGVTALAGCGARTVVTEGARERTKGIKFAKVDFQDKDATVAFDEKVISAQEVARAMSMTPHMMGRDMQYGGILLLSVPGVKKEATAKNAKAALSKIEGVKQVTIYPRHDAVGIEFASKGKVTSKKLIDVLDAAGLKASEYKTARAPAAPYGLATNGPNGAMSGQNSMLMDNGGMGAMGGMNGMGAMSGMNGMGAMMRMNCRCGGC